MKYKKEYNTKLSFYLRDVTAKRDVKLLVVAVTKRIETVVLVAYDMAAPMYSKSMIPAVRMISMMALQIMLTAVAVRVIVN